MVQQNGHYLLKLFKYGFGYVWESKAEYVDHKLFIMQFEERLKDSSQQE